MATEFKLVRKPKSANIAKRIIRQEVISKLKPVAEAVTKSHEQVVSNWNNKPQFKTDTTVTKDRIEIVTVVRRGKRLVDREGNQRPGPATTGDLWKWIDKGTRPHPIEAKNRPLLRFQAGNYQAKTGARPARYGGSGTISNPQWVSTKKLKNGHPGFGGRDFTGTIAKDLRKSFNNAIDSGYRSGLRKLKA